MAKVQIDIPQKHGIAHYAKGAVKAVVATTLPETPLSRARLDICKGCDYYSENSRNADTGRKVCRVCDCPAELKVKIPNEVCPLPNGLQKW